MPTLGSISERIRANKVSDAKLAAEIEARLDAVDEMKGAALPVLRAELEAQEYSVRSLHDDALAIKKAAEEVARMNGGPSLSHVPDTGSGGPPPEPSRTALAEPGEATASAVKSTLPQPVLDGTEISQVKWTGQ